MQRRQKIDSREMGLLIGVILNKYLFKSNHLHFGYWPEGLEVDFQNMPEAQENYCNFLASRIPAGATEILDVGCGTGAFARRLTDAGLKVDCLSPSTLLTERVRQLFPEGIQIFECRFEDLETDKLYDLVLFSESFQYLKVKQALAKIAAILKEGGHLLICDYFRTDAKGKSPHGGGHKFSRFERTMTGYPFELIKDIDITAQTAPNIALFEDFSSKVGVPVRDLIVHFMEVNHPLLNRLGRWAFRRRLDKINTKYFSGQRNAENFKNFKTYRCLLYQKTAPLEAAAALER